MIRRISCHPVCQPHKTDFKPVTLVVALAAAFASAALAQTLPTGGVAVHGQAAISSPTPNQLRVLTQNGAGTNHSAINWQSFSIGAVSSAAFVQPSTTSVSINRVVTNTPSVLLGHLSSNGHLVLVNQSGIAVGAGAVIDTAGFTASALRMTDADALAGRMRFGAAGAEMGGASGITVGGRITARDGDVVLVAPHIELGGSALVQAPNGSTILAAGQQVEITGRGLEGITMLVQAPADQVRNLGRLEGNAVGIFAGTLRHSGEIQATTASLEGGTVVLKAAGDAVVDGSAKVLATGTRGGRVDILGNRVAVTDQALVDASGAEGGGLIRVGGDYQGKNPEVPNAAMAYVGADAQLNASATTQGDGGKVIVWADDVTRAHGRIAADGGPQGGAGGWVETSGKRYLDVAGSKVTASSRDGRPGTWLLDPGDIAIVHGANGANVSLTGASPFQPVAFADAASVTDGTISAALDAQTNVVVNTSNGAGSVGDITFDGSFNGPVVITRSSSGSLGRLDIAADNNIFFFGSSSFTQAGTGGLGMEVNLIAGGANGITIQPGASVQLDGTGNGIGLVVKGGKTFTNRGGISMFGASYVKLPDESGYATFHNASGASIFINSTANWSFLSDSGVQGGIVNNDGDIIVNLSASGGTSWEALYNQGAGGFLSIANGKTVSAQNVGTLDGFVTLSGSGHLRLSEQHGGARVVSAAFVNSTGQLSVAPGVAATLAPAGGSVGQLSVQGAVVLSGGSTVQTAIYSQSAGASLTGGGNLTVTSAFNDGGGVFNPTGALDITQGSGPLNFGRSLSLASFGLHGNAALTLSGDISSSGNVVINTSLGALTLAGNVNAGSNAVTLSAQGGVNQTGGAITAGGALSATAGGSILLTQAANSFTSASFNSAGTVTVVDASSLNVTSLTSGANQAVSITAGGSLGLPAGAINTGAGNLTLSSGGTLTVPAALAGNNVALTSASDMTINADVSATGNFSATTTGPASTLRVNNIVSADGAMSLSLAGGLRLQSGPGQDAALNSVGNQSIDAKYVEVLASGSNGASILTTTGSQAITTHGMNGSGEGLAVKTSGSGDALVRTNAGGQAQTITVIDANAVRVQSLTASGTGFASINSNSPQTVAVRGTGSNFLVVGDAAGAGSSGIFGPAQTITAGQSAQLGGIQVVGGTTETKSAFLSNTAGGSNQTISTTGTISIVGGSALLAAVEGNGALGFIYNNGVSNQTVTANAISMVGGSGGSFNQAVLGGEGSQFITVGAGGIALTGGSGTGIRNIAGINQKAAAGTQSITVNNGGSIVLQGGNASGIGVPGNGSSFAGIESSGASQTINFTAGGDVRATGGTVGAGNNAIIQMHNGTQTISGASLIQVRGGSSGGGTNNGNTAYIESDVGSQTISAQSIVLQGGSGGTENGANIGVNSGGTGTQSITANSIALQGGVAGTFNGAAIYTGNGRNQTVNVGAGGLTLTGGGGGVTDLQNGAVIFQKTGTGTQTINVAGGGAITLQAGSGAASNVGFDSNGLSKGSSASILSQGAAQLVNFTAPGGSISATGGTVGTNNFAVIEATGVGSQTIQGSVLANAPSITLTGGASGGNSTEPNVAVIRGSDVNSQTISAAAGTLASGLGDNLVLIVAQTQSLQFNGNLALMGAPGGNNNGGVRIGGRSTTDTNLTLGVGGDLTLSGGATSGVAVGSAATNIRTNTIAITATGDVILSPSAVGGVRIGNGGPGGELLGSSVSVTAGGNIVLNSSGGAGSARVHSLGNVALSATNAGKSITQASDSRIAANQLTVAANAGISMDSAINEISSLSATNSGIGNISVTNKPGVALTVTGITQGGGNVRISADSLAITGAVNAGIGTVTLRPVTLSRDVTIEASPSGGALSLSPASVQNVTAGVLEIGRLDGTSNLNLNASLSNSNINAASLRLLSGNNIISSTGNSIGNGGGGTFNAELRASNDVTLTNGNVFVGDNRSLTIAADNDSSGQGIVAIGAVTLQAGASAGNTTSNMSISGKDITIAVSGNGTGLVTVLGTGTQTISAANNLTLSNTNAVSGQLNFRTDGGAQSVTVGGNLTLSAGTGTANNVVLYAGGDQSLMTAAIVGNGGATGFGNSISIEGQRNQNVTVGAGGIQLTGGGGALATDSNNRAFIYHYPTAGTNQTVTVNGGGSIILQGGSSAKNASGSNQGSFAYIGSEEGTQTIGFTAGGNLSLTGGTVGSRNYALVYSTGLAQSIAGASNITVTGGASGGTATDGNTGFINSGTGPQTISAGTIALQGGGGGTLNLARILSGNTQSLTANSISLTGGAAGGGLGTGNSAAVVTSGNQNISVGGGGLTLTGGGGTLTDNMAQVYQSGTTGTSQTITISGGGTLAMTGGSSAQTNVGGSGHGSRALLEADGDSQLIQFNSGGAIQLTGGTVGSRAFAEIYAKTGTQTISGAPAITLTGGASGGFAGEGNTAGIYADAAAQTISATALALSGGASGIDNRAEIASQSDQTISVTNAPTVSIRARAGKAGLFAAGNQTVDITGAASANALTIGDASTAEVSFITGNNQIVTVGGGGQSGSITIGGGIAAGKNSGIFNNSGTQTISTAGALTMTGGTAVGSGSTCAVAGSGACADIANTGTGLQSVSATTVNIQGGSGGVSNGAGIFVNGGPQQLTVGAGGLHLTGGTGTGENFASIGGNGANGQTLTINVAGNTTLDATNSTTGSSTFIGLGGTGDLGSVTVNFIGSGNLTLTGSNVLATRAGAAIGAGTNQTNATAAVSIQAADVILNAGTQAGARFGHAAGADGPGDVNVVATGNIAFNSNGAVGSVVRTTGNVSLTTNGAGKSISEGAASLVSGNALSVSAPAGITMAGPNAVNTLNAASTGAGGISFSNIQSLTVGPVTTPVGTQTIQLSALGGGSALTLAGMGGDDAWSLVSGGATVMGGAFNGNSLSLTSGAALTLAQNITTAGALSLITPNANTITQTSGVISVGGSTSINAGSADVTLTGLSNDFNQIGAVGGTVRIRDTNAITVGTSNLGKLVVQAAGNLTLNGTISASGSGDAVALASTAGNINAAGGAINTPAGRWLLYLVSPGADNFGTLTPAFKQYGATLVSSVLGTGNGLLYGNSPTITGVLGTGVVATKTYDALTGIDVSNPLITVTASGALAGDTVTLAKVGSGTLADKNVGTGKSVTTGVQIASATSGAGPVFGYTFLDTGTTSSSASATIGTVTGASLAVTGVSASNKSYDGTTVASLSGSASVSGFGTDIVSVGGVGVASFDTKNVGNAKPVTVSGYVLIGTAAGNYTVVQPTALTANVSAASISSVTGITAANRVYNGSTSASLTTSGASFVGVQGVDVLTVSGATGNFTDKNVANPKTVNITGITLGGSDAGNYTLASNTATTTAAITPATISAVAGLTASRQYDGTVTATPVTTGAIFAGGVPNDNLVVSAASASFADKNVGTGKALTASGLTLSGTDAGNYSFAVASASGTGSITQRPLATWTGSSGDGLWSTSANWQGGVVPDVGLGNSVANVAVAAIPAGAGVVQLNVPLLNMAIQSLSPITQTGASSLGGDMQVSAAGGLGLTGSGNLMAKLTASNVGSGNLDVVNATALDVGLLTNSGGSVSLVNTGGITTTGLVSALANVALTANSPLTIGAPGVVAGGSISLVASNLTSTGNMTLNGPVTAGTTVLLDAAGTLMQNAAVLGPTGVTATAGLGTLFGPLATTNGSPISYTVGGVSVSPPPTSLEVLLDPAVAPGDTLTTFAALLEAAVNAQDEASQGTNPDGSKKKKSNDTIMTEGDVCR